VSGALEKARALATNPRMVAKYAAWLGAKLSGRECRAALPAGGTLGGFRRFSDFWTLNLPAPAEYQLLRRVATPGAVLVDVGANLGAFAITMSRLCPSARIVAFEPVPSTVSGLRANIAVNGVTNVEVVEVAVTDRSGRVQVTDDPICPPRNRIVAETASPEKSVSVAATTLDEFCAGRGIERLAFLKSDTEGAETRVIRGADRLLRERRIDCLLVEVCGPHLDEMGSSIQDLMDAIERVGYAAHRLRADGTAGKRLSVADLEAVPFENVLIR
jgi:FkbM family methyltransferase